MKSIIKRKKVAEQLVDTIHSELDAVEYLAVTKMVKCLAAGTSHYKAFAAANEILIGNERDPIPYPLETSTLNSVGAQKEVAV